MARGKGEGTITKLDNGTYCGRLTVGYDENGKQKRKAFYGKTKTEVQKKMNAAKADLDKGSYIEPSRMTVAAWMDTWLDEYKKNSIRPSTYYRYKVYLDNDIKPLLGRYKLKELRNDIVQKFVNDLYAKGRASATTERAYTILKTALEQAVDNELIPKNVASKVTLPQNNPVESRAMTLEEQEKFIECAKEARHGEMFILAVGTGMRIGELLALTWSDVDFTNGVIKVSKSASRYMDFSLDKPKLTVTSGPTKTRAGNRIIPLLPDILDMLKRLYENRIQTEKNLVFTVDGKVMDPGNARQTFHRIRKKAGIDESIHPHCLRHTFATRGLENGIELKVMQELLGHASIKMTGDIYTHVLQDMKTDSMMKLADVIKI